MNRSSNGRIALGLVLAVLGALVAPLMLIFAGTFVWSPILIAALYAWAGPLPALFGAALTLISPAMMVGLFAALSGLPVPVGTVFAEAVRLVVTEPTWMTVASLMLVLPGIAAIALLRRRMPFFRAMAWSVGAQLALTAMGILTLSLRYGPDLVGTFTGWFKDAAGEMASIPSQSALLGAMLQNMGQMGVFGLNTGIDFTKSALTAAEQLQLTGLMVDVLDRLLRVNLVAMILSSCVTTGIISYMLPAHICARRGDEPHVPYVHIHNWRLPRDMVIALPLITLGCAIADGLQVQGMDAALSAMWSLCMLAFLIQGVGALARRMRQSGMPPTRRAMTIALVLLFVHPMTSQMGFPVMVLIGAWSAVLGSHGVVTEYIQKRNSNKEG